MVALDISHERRRNRRAAAASPLPVEPVPHRPPARAAKAAHNSGGPAVPQSVKGRFRRIKTTFLVMALAIYGLLPFLRWTRAPGEPDQAVLIDLEKGRLHLFFLDVWPQELYLLTGLLILATLTLILMNALAGRVWCGFMCPQTVWSDLFLTVERLVEGDRRERLKKRSAPLDARRIGELALKHGIWISIALWTGAGLALYFDDAPTMLRSILTGEASLLVYSWIVIIAGTTYALAGFAREIVCTSMCPWPRLQGAIWDPEALTVNYRDYRGEPRGSVKKSAELKAAGKPAGDCVDCLQCVVVCPIGIDIRQGPSFACINCGLCVDACDSVMSRLGRPRGLIDYESWRNIERGRLRLVLESFRLYRPGTLGPVAAIMALVILMGAVVGTRSLGGLFADHERTPLATRLSDGRIRNAYTLRITNKEAQPRQFTLHASGLGAELALGVIGPNPVIVEGNATADVRVTLSAPAGFEGEVAFRAEKQGSQNEIYIARDQFFTLH
jgi:cytochrome c oxidase accessory protein FixG